MLARCRAPNITEYYASVLKPGTTQLLIIMELMAASAADLVWHLPLSSEVAPTSVGKAHL